MCVDFRGLRLVDRLPAQNENQGTTTKRGGTREPGASSFFLQGLASWRSKVWPNAAVSRSAIQQAGGQRFGQMRQSQGVQSSKLEV